MVTSVGIGLMLAFWVFPDETFADGRVGQRFEVLGAFVAAAGFGGGFAALLFAAFQIRSAFPRPRLAVRHTVEQRSGQGLTIVLSIVNMGAGAPGYWAVELDFVGFTSAGLTDSLTQTGLWNGNQLRWVYRADGLRLYTGIPVAIARFQLVLEHGSSEGRAGYLFVTESYRERRPTTLRIRSVARDT
ncbi:MAG: hypothetical protein WEC75_08405 [Dehalococcoidia bacterium]